MPRSTKSVYKKAFIFVLVLVLLLLSLTGCKKTQPEEEGLPVLTIDGVNYPVTAEDGIKGLPNAHDGVIVRSSKMAYDPVLDVNFTKWENDLYKNDGTCLTDYQGDVKFRLDWFGTLDLDSGINMLAITTSFMPVQVPAGLDEEAFGKLMEENGFLKYYSRDYYSKIYTEHGAIDMLSEDFITSIVEYFRRELNFSKNKYDDAYVINKINNSPNLPRLRYDQVKKMLIQDLNDGTSTLYCELRVTYRNDRAPDCQVILYAKENTISSWRSKWNPSGLPVEKDQLML